MTEINPTLILNEIILFRPFSASSYLSDQYLCSDQPSYKTSNNNLIPSDQ